MPHSNINDLLAFIAVARERSFTRAAAKLDVSQSALSHTLRGLEAQLGVRLLNRTTRSVSPTETGERLLRSVGPRFEEIENELAALGELRDRPAGTVRITTGDHVLRSTLLSKLLPLLHKYPDIKLEFDVSYGFRDIVADRFDAGVRLGESVDRDDSAASLVTAGTVPASRPLAPAATIPFAAARPAFGNRYFARFPPHWLYAPARPSHACEDSGLLRPLGLPQALRLGASRLPWLIA